MAKPTDRKLGCLGFRQQAALSRREMLTVGALSGMGLLLPDLFRARSQARAGQGSGTFGRAKSVILMYLHGGPPQQETWDPKPDAPAEARGEFTDQATSLPGVRISELLPRSAEMMHKLAVIRSLSHDNANHVQASLSAMTGHHHPPGTESRGDFPPSQNDFPPFGAVLDHLRPSAADLPTWVQVGPLMRRNNGTVLHGQLPGFLGAKHSPFAINQDLLPDDVKIGAVASSAELPVLRLRSRRDLLAQVDAQRRLIDRSAEASTLDRFYQKAFNLLSSDATAKAFDLASESTAMRDRYGRTQFGQCCLLGRRLAEAGVPMTNVHYCHTPKGSWDTHSDNFNKMKNSLAPTFDQAFSALVNDLDERGMLEETLVIATAEFGRTPKINKNAGRDHWPWVYAIALAGAGVGKGVVYGSSDKIAAYPDSNPHDPSDVAATVYHLLGVPADTTIYDQVNRPYYLVNGKKIDALLA